MTTSMLSVNAFLVEIIALKARDAKYSALLFAIERKHPGETRHETALRYILDAERRTSMTDKATPLVEDIASLVYEAMIWAALKPNDCPPPWRNGNSLAENEARDAARAVLGRVNGLE